MIQSCFKWLSIVLIACSFHLQATPDDEPLAQKLKDTFQKPYLSLGFVLQVVGDGQVDRIFPGNNGFNISNMRVVIYGELDKKFGYLLRTNFINSPAVLDAKLSWRLNAKTTFHAGLFKAPFSKEFLTGAESIDMVNRSQVVSALTPGRQIGMQITAKSNAFYMDAGIFNGNGFANNNNDDENFMYVGRLGVTPELENATLDAGVNAAFSKDRAARVAGSTFRGDRTLFGADVRLESGKFLLAGEYIYSNLASNINNSPEINPQGYHLTAGFMVADNNQVLIRWDQFDLDSPAGESNLLIFGYNLWPTTLTELQINYVIDTDESAFDHHQLLINAQVAF